MTQSHRDRLTRAFLRHQYMLMDSLRSLVGNRSDADNLFQELGVVVLRKEPSAVPADDGFLHATDTVLALLRIERWR